MYDAFISYSHAADGQLAPAIQNGLQRLAKKTFQRRALRVFRDETGLSTNPHLWDSIASAIADSEWFVLLASPESARSAWVDREVRTWLDTKPLDHILVVVTDGDLAFRPGLGVDRDSTTCLPEPLIDALVDEPRWLDLRWARTDTQLDLRNGRFRAAIADLAAPIHGVAKDDLEGEDVRQQKRAKRLATTGITAVALLAIASAIGAAIAIDQRSQAVDQRQEAATQRDEAARQRDEASKQRDEASKQRDEADAQRKQATEQRDEAEAQRARADAASNTAAAKALAAQATALSPTDIDLGLLLAAEGYRRDPSLDTEFGLLTALDEARGINRFVRDLPPGILAIAISPDRSELYAVTAGGSLLVIDVASLTATEPPLLTGLVGVVALVLSTDGRRLAVSAQAGVTVYDVPTKTVVARGLGGGSASVSLNDDGSLVAIGPLGQAPVQVIEVDTAATVFEVKGSDVFGVFLPDRRIAVQELGSSSLALYSIDGSHTTPLVSRDGLPPGTGLAVSPDGTLLVTGGLDGRVALLDSVTLEPRGPLLSVRGSRLGDIFFSPDGSIVGLGSDDGSVRLFQVATSALILELTGLTGNLVSAFLDDHGIISTSYLDDAAVVWDAGQATQIGTAGPPLEGPITGLRVIADGEQVVMDVGGEIRVSPVGAPATPTVRRVLGVENRALTVAESAGLVATYAFVIDETTGDLLDRSIHVMHLDDLSDQITISFGMNGIENLALSPDGTLLAVGHRDGQLSVYDTTTGAAVLPPQPVDRFPCCVGLLVWNATGSRLHVGGQDGTLRTFDTATWKQLGEHVLSKDEGALRLGRLSPDGTTVMVPSESGAVYLVDAETGAPVSDPFIAAGTQLQSAAIVMDGQMLAAEGRDGRLRLWDIASHRALGPAIAGHIESSLTLDALTESIVLSGGGFDRRLITWNLDPAFWAERACELAGRNLTHAEWDRYVGGDYQITCPAFPEGT